jgi:hypothetical protein
MIEGAAKGAGKEAEEILPATVLAIQVRLVPWGSVQAIGISS